MFSVEGQSSDPSKCTFLLEKCVIFLKVVLFFNVPLKAVLLNLLYDANQFQLIRLFLMASFKWGLRNSEPGGLYCWLEGFLWLAQVLGEPTLQNDG